MRFVSVSLLPLFSWRARAFSAARVRSINSPPVYPRHYAVLAPHGGRCTIDVGGLGVAIRRVGGFGETVMSVRCIHAFGAHTIILARIRIINESPFAPVAFRRVAFG